MDARIEAYLDDELPADERARFEQSLAADADWDAEVFLARQIRESLRTNNRNDTSTKGAANDPVAPGADGSRAASGGVGRGTLPRRRR